MRRSLVKKITLSILTGAILLSSNVVWAATTVDVKDNSANTNPWTGIVVNKSGNPAGPGDSTTQAGAIAIGSNSQSSLESVSIGTTARAGSQYSVAIGYESKVSGENSVALGANAKVPGYANSVALGYGSLADDDNVVSVGSGNGSVSYKYRRIINVADGVSSHDAVTLGQLQSNYYDIDQIDDMFSALGGASSGTGSVDLSDYAKTSDVANTYATKDALTNDLATKANSADVYRKDDADAKFADKAETQNKLDAKADKTALTAETTERIAADQALQAQIDSFGGSDAINGINQRLEKTNAKINKVGAGAAALAALHPLDYDPDDKLTFSAGMGNYAGENAAALGAFYRPNEKFMVSLGGTMGNGENMVNLGLSIGLDKPNGYAKLSKRELIQKVNVMEAKYEQVEAENEAMKAEMAEMKAMLQELLAKK